MTTYAGITNLSNMTDAYSISDSTVVFGTFLESNGQGFSLLAPASWQGGVLTAPVSFSVLYTNMYLTFGASNSSGTLVGGGHNPSLLSSAQTPAVWQNGAVAYLSLWGGDTSGYAYSINNAGMIVGQTGNHALLWQNGVAQLLSPLSSDVGATAIAINDNGLIFGDSFASGYLPGGIEISHAVTWNSGVASAMPTVSGEVASFIYSVNSAGTTVGDVYLSDNFAHAGLWQNGKLTVLATPFGYQESHAVGLDNSSRVVGYAVTNSGSTHAILWDSGTETDLNSLLPANSGWILQYANAINNNGQIVGDGVYNGADASFLLTLGGGSGTVAASAALMAIQSYQSGTLSAPLVLSDNMADVLVNLDGLQGLAAAGRLSKITLTDSGIPQISVTQSQLSGDVSALNTIGGVFTLSVPAGSSSTSITGLANHANTVVFNGHRASDYNLSAAGGSAVNAVGGSIVVHLSGVQQLQFSDRTVTVAANNSTSEYVALLYQAALGRTPDGAGLQYWQTLANALPAATQAMGVYGLSDAPGNYNGTLSIAGGFTNSAEFVAKYGSLSNTQFVTQLYGNVLDRLPESAGLNYWVSELASGESREHVLIGFAESSEAIANATKGFIGQSGAHAAWLFLS